MNKSLQLLCVLLFFISCKSENERRIVGKWQAAQLMECDNLVPIQTELVDIEFLSNGKYIFHSTLNVKEEGNYRIKKNFLFTQDKLREKAVEKAVLIKSIDTDTLVLQMSYKGKDQWLTLIREGVSEKAREKEEADAKAKALAAAAGTAAVAEASLPNNALDTSQKDDAAKKAEEEKKKQAEADKAAESKKAEAAADKKREEEADRKREAAKKKEKDSDKGLSASEAYKKREAKRKAEERKAKEEAENKAAKFRKEYAKREAEKKKNKK